MTAAGRPNQDMEKRFEGAEGLRRLVAALCEHTLVNGSEEIARDIASVGTLIPVESGEIVLSQDAIDSDIYFIVLGTVSILVNGREVARRSIGDHVGEMTLIDPTTKRSGTVRTVEASLFLKVTESDFSSVANKYPKLWRRIAIELGSRLRQRGVFHRTPNSKPLVFIASSREALDKANRIFKSIESADIEVKVWTDGIFEASATAIESLEAVMESFDFGIVVLNADDVVESRGANKVAPRDNAIFELGLFIGAFGRKRTFIVKPRGIDIKIPSDLLGVTCLDFDESSPDLLEKSVSKVGDNLRSKIAELGSR